MKLTLLILALLSGNLIAQNISIDFDYNTGRINEIFIAEESMVFILTPSGQLCDIYRFNTEAEAQQFAHQTQGCVAPNNILQLSNTRLHVNTISEIDYYKSYEHNAGSIKNVNGLFIEYFAPYEANVGTLKKIGAADIDRFTQFQNNTGKISQIGPYDINYFAPYENNPEKIKQIGALDIEYFTVFENNSGRVKKIGGLTFEYFGPYEGPNYGKFKAITGTEEQLKIF